MKIYAMEKSFLTRLLSDRRELFSFARAVGNAEQMRAARDELMTAAQINKTPKNGETVQYKVIDGAAHIPITGQLTPSADPCGAFTGQAETEYGFIQAAAIQAEDDPAVSEIAFDTDSPGGYVSGLDETAQIIGMLTKPTTAYVGNMAASAAYWLASQADKIIALSPASQVGSIGVALEEYDDDQALAAEGITHRVYTSTDAPDKRPDTKTQEGQAKVISQLDALHSIFVRRVAEGRKVSEEKVNKDFGRGGVLLAEAAMAAGMIDEVRGSHIKKEKSSGVPGALASGPKLKQEVNMTEQEIQALKDQSFQAGIDAEKKRTAGLNAWKGLNPDADRVVDDAISQGKTYDDVAPQLAAAVAKGKSKEADGDNAPAVASGTVTNGAGVSGLDEKDMEAAAMFGLSLEDYRKYAKEGK